MPRPRSLTSAQIATAALGLVDRTGLDALSMRAVATELGMGTMSLYRYVSDRNEVEALVVDLVLREGEGSVSPGPAGQRLSVLADRVRIAASTHPEVVPLLLTHRHRSPSSLRWGESVLTVLTEAGFTGRHRVIAFRSLLSYVFGALQVERHGPLAGAGTAVLAALPAEEFPILSETARQARTLSPEQEFQRGLDVVLRGLGL
ncbi:MAG: TetR/AcrR family transcriptional regulator C-terminal domain-containing protein [Pseudonocardia sp.]|nr:TetR/AcrR family transcriptional regulator C-terminal domain-containing protein [Pseudonocardia sp.]